MTLYHYERRGVTLCCHKPANAFPGHRNSGHAFTIDRAKVTCPGAPTPPLVERPVDPEPVKCRNGHDRDPAGDYVQLRADGTEKRECRQCRTDRNNRRVDRRKKTS